MPSNYLYQVFSLIIFLDITKKIGQKTNIFSALIITTGQQSLTVVKAFGLQKTLSNGCHDHH